MLIQSLWSIREHAPVSLMLLSRQAEALEKGRGTIQGKLFKYDISLRLEEVPAFQQELVAELKQRGFMVRSSGLSGLLEGSHILSE